MDEHNLPFVTIAVPTYNRCDRLVQCLESLSRIDYPAHRHTVIVVDDCSNDQTFERMRQCAFAHDRLTYVRLERHQGVSAARNRALAMAQGEFVAFFDDDCLIDPSWLREAVRVLGESPRAAAVGGSIRLRQDFPVAWASYILEFSMWFPAGRTRSIRDLPACNIVYRRADIEGMRFRIMESSAVYEDSLFNHELRLRKKELIFLPSISVCHFWSGTRVHRQGFLESQRRYGLGFLQGGHVVHGLAGGILYLFPFINVALPRLVFVFFRCVRAGQSKKFFQCLPLLWQGERERHAVIAGRGCV